ncbi:hypothetical protein D3C83_232900 [compost metagenome]
MLSQTAGMTGDFRAVTGNDHLIERDPHVHPPANEAGIHRVVIGLDPDVVVPGQASGEPP